jgi:hypothetical protein
VSPIEPAAERAVNIRDPNRCRCEGCVVAHYLAACQVAKLSPADIASTFSSAADMRELVARVASLAIPDAAALLRRRAGLS